MGYNTKFKLVVGEDADMKKVTKDSQEIGGYGFVQAFRDLGSFTDDLKWAYHEIDMRVLSARNPGILFILTGIGEDTFDIWRKYFINGKMQVAEAKITFDDVDPAKLK